MSKLLYSATMSLDGFIAGVGGDMSWLTPYVGRPSPEIDELVSNIGALLVGKRTFTGDDPSKGTDAEGAFGGRWSGPLACSPTSELLRPRAPTSPTSATSSRRWRRRGARPPAST